MKNRIRPVIHRPLTAPFGCRSIDYVTKERYSPNEGKIIRIIIYINKE